MLKTAFWSALVFAFVMAIVPHPPGLPLEPSDKVQHIIAFLTLAGLAAAAYPAASLWRIGAWLSGFGALIEIVQSIPALHRSPDVRDWIADVAAVALSCCVAGLVRRATRLRGAT